MGTTCCITLTDGIAIASIIVDALVAYWIVKTIQNKLTNKRVLKDLIINEIIEIRKQYDIFINDLLTGKVKPKEVVPKLKMLSVKINDLMAIIPKSYKIKNEELMPYQYELNTIITNDEDYGKNYNVDNYVTFSNKAQFYEFQQKNSHLFNDLIVKINDAK